VRLASLPIALLILAAGFLALAGSAQALTLQTTTAPTHSWQQWTNESQMPMANINVAFQEFHGHGPCDADGAPACTTWATSASDSGQITDSAFAIAVTTDDAPMTLRHYLWHEETHVFDGAVMTNYWRAQFMAAWGLPGGTDAWWTALPRTDGGSAGEWFAEAGAACDRYGLNIAHSHLPDLNDWAVYNFPAWGNMAALERSCQLIVAAGRAASLPVPAQRSYPPRAGLAKRHGSRPDRSGTGTARGEG
jgi:hypothetical protein